MKLTQEQIAKLQKKVQHHFKKTHPEWICTIEGPYLVIQLNWMDATYFNGQGVAHEARIYRHLVEILPSGRFKTMDVTADSEKAIGLEGVTLSMNSFAGKQFIFHADARLGKDNQTGKKGIITYRFNNNDIKKPVREYLEHFGLKYQFMNSPVDEFNAIYGPTKLANGFIFAVVGLIFLIFMAFLWLSPGMEITETINGVTQTKTLGEANPVLKTVFTIFPAVFIYFSAAFFVSYKKYNAPAKKAA